MSKKGLIRRLFFFVAFVAAAILLIFLIKNNWNVAKAFSDIAGLLGKKQP